MSLKDIYATPTNKYQDAEGNEHELTYDQEGNEIDTIVRYAAK